MTDRDLTRRLDEAMEVGRGILQLAPAWVPRTFLVPGKRMGLDQRDLYPLGAHRGGIVERWLASTATADNGPDAPEDEGLSYVVTPDGGRLPLRDAVSVAGPALIGSSMMEAWGRWPVFSKFFDCMGSIPHHLHQTNDQAVLVGKEHKPEAYYFPPQLNFATNNFPLTYFGLEPGTTKDDVLQCLERWNTGENGILHLSRAYCLKPGSGWVVPAGILHCPGSLCTYEVQWNSDIFAMFQSLIDGRLLPWEFLVKDVPQDKQHDLDYLVSLIDWDANTNPTFKQDHYIEPVVSRDSHDEGYQDRWVIYGKMHGEDLFSAKELTVLPGARATLEDAGASGVVVTQGRGKLEAFDIDTTTSVRYGELTRDEYFIPFETATSGFSVRNTGHEPLVLLRYFGPGVGSKSIGDLGLARKGRYAPSMRSA